MADRLLVDTPSLRRHKRQLAWQILVPISVFAALIIAGAALVAFGTPVQARLWADVSAIWMIAPMLLFGLLALATLVFFIYGMFRLLQVTPLFTFKLQGWLAAVSSGSRRAADGAAKPVIWVHQARAAVRAFLAKFS